MPAKRSVLTVQPPIGGVSKLAGFQNHPPHTSYDSVNFWPVDVKTGRRITSTRPPLVDFVSPGTTVNALVRVNGHIIGKPFQSIVAASGTDLFWYDGVAWTVATGAAASLADDGRAVFGSPYLQHAYICKADSEPIDFDYVTGQATIMSTFAGTVPTNCRIAFTWQGSLCLAGQIERPHILYMSRTGDANDWDFSVPVEDVGGAYTSAGDAEGLLNGPITAGFSHTSDSAIISTHEGIIAWRAHPRRGGVPENISDEYILGQGAWTKTPGDHAYFMTTAGLFHLPPTPGSIPTPVSLDKIPDELIGLTYDYEDPTMVVEYDSRWRLIYILDRALEIAWVFDVITNSFHRMTVDNYPYVAAEHRPFITEDRSGVLFGRSP